MTRKEIFQVLNDREVKFKQNSATEALLAQMNEQLAKEGIMPVTLEDPRPGLINTEEPDDTAELGQIAMLRNVKHNGVFYRKGTTYQVDEDTAELFKTATWAQ